jgi:hypothetical protein
VITKEKPGIVRQNSGHSTSTLLSSKDLNFDKQLTLLAKGDQINPGDELAKTSSYVQHTIQIEVLENLLFNLCKDYTVQLKSPRIMLDSIMTVYDLHQRLQIEPYLNEDEKNGLYEEVGDLAQRFPFALEEFLWIERAVNLINLLAIKWRVVDVKNYGYRVARKQHVDDVAKL